MKVKYFIPIYGWAIYFDEHKYMGWGLTIYHIFWFCFVPYALLSLWN
jgi:hypothetical protein